MQYNAKVDILRVVKTSDGAGGWTEVENVLHNDLPCRIVWSKGFEKVQFTKDTHYCDAKLFCRVIDVTTNDRATYDSKTYEIVDVSNPDNKDKRLVISLKLIG